MDKLLYVAMSGAKQTMFAQAVNANNLANVSTKGYRGDFSVFQSMPVNGPGYASRVYTSTEQAGVNFSPGSLMTTGRELDIAVRGEGWIAVQAPDGTEAYTRAGDLHVGAGGQLVNGSGFPVLGNGGPIAVPPYEKIEIGADGTISIRPVGQSATALAIVDRIKLVDGNFDRLIKDENGLMRPKDGIPLIADAAIEVVSGVAEGSNVGAVDAMVNMIELSRQFEMQVKMMKQAEELDASATEILRLG